MGGHWLAANLILENGTEEQRQKYMPEAVAGKIFAFGLTESSAGSDAAAGVSLLSAGIFFPDDLPDRRNRPDH